MIIPVKKGESNASKRNGRMLIISILFFVPSAILFYSAMGMLEIVPGFVNGVISGYVSVVFLLLIYIGLIKFITWFFAKLRINWR